MSLPRTSSRLGAMVPRYLNRVLIRAGQRRSTCSGVSASSRQTEQMADGQCLSSHWVQTLEGACPTLCRHCVELVQWPALSWWTSTAVALFPPATGRGRREPISRWYHPAAQARMVRPAPVSPPPGGRF